jgi:molybdenum cofactor cytidylyltransferase
MCAVSDGNTCSVDGAAAIILAAGFSRRLGRPKQTVVIGGETLLGRAVRVAMEAELSPVIVVVQPGAEFAEELRAGGCLLVVNEEAAEGIASSIRRGVATAKMLQAAGVVVMTCDQVGLRPEHLQALIAEPAKVAASGYAGRVGIPAYFPSDSFAALMELRGDTGARELLRGERVVVVVDEQLALDIDTEADVARATSIS